MHWAATSWFYLLLVSSSISLVMWIHGREHACDVNRRQRTCLRCESTAENMLAMWIDGREHACNVNRRQRTCLKWELMVENMHEMWIHRANKSVVCFRTIPSSTPLPWLIAYWTHGVPSSYVEWTLLYMWLSLHFPTSKTLKTKQVQNGKVGRTVHYCLVHGPPNCCMFFVFFRTCYY